MKNDYLYVINDTGKPCSFHDKTNISEDTKTILLIQATHIDLDLY